MAGAGGVRVLREGWFAHTPWTCLFVAGVVYGLISPVWEVWGWLSAGDRPFPSWIDGVYAVACPAAITFL
ncbi:MAG: hypothetical protein WD011_05170, partial [Nitriliruptoraceae bacterium]